MDLGRPVSIHKLLLFPALVVALNDVGKLVIFFNHPAIDDTETILIPGVGNFLTHLKVEIPPAGSSPPIGIELQLLGRDPGREIVLDRIESQPETIVDLDLPQRAGVGLLGARRHHHDHDGENRREGEGDHQLDESKALLEPASSTGIRHRLGTHIFTWLFTHHIAASKYTFIIGSIVSSALSRRSGNPR